MTVSLLPMADYARVPIDALPRGPRAVVAAAGDDFAWDARVSRSDDGLEVVAVRLTSFERYSVGCPNGCPSTSPCHLHMAAHRAWIVYRGGKFHGAQFMRAGDIARNVKVGELKALLSDPPAAPRVA